MLRVILVIDDYNELIYLQTLLKKLGFDVEGLQNTKKYTDISLGFNPQVVIVTARGKKVDGMALVQTINRRRGFPKIIALKGKDISLNQDQLLMAGVDTVLSSPVQPQDLIAALAQHGGADEASLLEKYAKIQSTLDAPHDDQVLLSFDENGQPIEKTEKVRSTIEALTGVPTLNRDKIEVGDAPSQAGGPSEDFKIELPKTPDPQRQARFEQKRAEIGSLPKSHFNRDLIREFNKKIRAWIKPDDIEEVEAERKKFVRALFKK